MSSEELTQDGLFATISGPLDADALARHFSRRSDLTYRRIEDVTVSAADMYMSLLTGSLIRNCVFNKVVFNRSDLDGVRAEKSSFVECDFTNCDIRSSVFANCIFEACTFNGAFIDDCQLQGCDLVSCTLESATLTHCNFRKSSLRACKITRASFLHSKLYDCKVSDINVGDCTILFVILRDCQLINISLSAECVGGIFGITREQLDQAKIFYLGEQEPVPPDSDLLKLIYEQYLQRKWYIGQLVLNLNFDLVSTLAAFDAYLSLSYKRFAEFEFAKGDELEFIGDLLEELAFLNRLPLLTLLNTLEWCTALESKIKQGNRDSHESLGDPFRAFVSRVVLLTNSLLDKLDRAMPEIRVEESDRPICIKVTFDQKPILSLPELLNTINSSSPLGLAQRSHLIRVEQGSYVEIVLTTLFSIVALQVFLYLINGCVIQLTELKERTKTLARKRAPKSYVELALSNTQHGSPLVLSILPGLLAHAKGLPWLKGASLGGYLASNLKSLREVECGDASSASSAQFSPEN